MGTVTFDLSLPARAGDITRDVAWRFDIKSSQNGGLGLQLAQSIRLATLLATTMKMRINRSVIFKLAIEPVENRCSDMQHHFGKLRETLGRLSSDAEAPQETQMAINENLVPKREKRGLSPEAEMPDERQVHARTE